VRNLRNPRDKVLVVGIDGLRFDRLVALAPPTLSALMASGAYGTSLLPYGEAAGPRTGSPGEVVPDGLVAGMARSDSGPGWSSIASGVWPDKHGVVDNAFASHHFEKYLDFLTRAKEARPGLATAAFFSWAALAEHGAFGPGIDTLMVLDGFALTFATADDRIADAAEHHLSATGTAAELLFVYLGETDEVAHRVGPLCREYTEALHVQDAILGRFLDAIRARPSFADERWTVLITTDHGHVDEGGHGGDSIEERTVFLVVNHLDEDLGGAPLAAPSLVDVAPTALALLGIQTDPAWDWDGAPAEIRPDPDGTGGAPAAS
jgi:hypothetical protein